MLLTPDDGFVAKTPEDAEQAEAAGYTKCPTVRVQNRKGAAYGQPCQFHISPETQSALQDNGGYYTCPHCQHSHDFLHEMPWHGVQEDEMTPEARDQFNTGGGTRIGLGLDVQSQIGEDLVRGLGELPGYGPITWWHDGGSLAASPLDGATKDWGIEVKTLGYDTTHHRFIPGRPKEKTNKNEMAAQMNKKGVLGVLVLLDFRRSVADIFAKADPLEDGGTKTYRTKSEYHLIKETPFKNPLMDPLDPSPTVKEEMPF